MSDQRLGRYAQLIHEASGCDGCPVHPEDIAGARAVLAVADDEIRAALEDAATAVRARKTGPNADIGPNGRQLERRAIADMLRARAEALR